MRVLHAPNPLSLQTDFIALIGEDDRLSPHEIIAQNALCFCGPVLCQVNDGFWLRQDWDARLPVGATVRFISVPQGNIGKILASIAVVALAIAAPYALGIAGTMGGTLLSAAVSIGGMLLIGMLFPAASAGDLGTPDTMYSLSNSNRMRPGEPYAERFGRTQFYPDIACSYTTIADNEQYVHALLIPGIGYFSDTAVYIDKTPLADYSGTSWSVVEPGADPDFLVVWTSAEAGGQELSTDWITYIVNPRGTSATALEYDVVFSGGLIGYNDEGDAYSAGVTVAAEARLVNAYGVATGGWVQLDNHTFRAASKNPLRYSRSCAVPSGAGRYEFRVRRTSAASGGSQVVDQCSLGGLRAWGCKHPTVDDVTLIKISIKATDQLNGDVASKILVHATRKLYPVTSSGFGTTRAASRSIVDMVAYAATAANGGQLDDDVLTWDVLAELRAEFAANGWYFDWGWTSRVSVMEACSTAAACGLSIMYTPGGKVCLACDTAQVSYGVPFTDDDFDPGSLEITTSFQTAASNTCIRVTYYDWNSGQEETIDCYEDDGSDYNPKEIALNGCTDRQHAYEIGMRLYRNMMRSTVAVAWSTGLKGNLPSMFQWAPISSTAANILASGIIVAVETGKIWLSEPVDFGGETSGWLRLATPEGGHAGPYSVTPTEYAHCVGGSVSGLKTLKADGPNEAQRYIFGTDVKTVRLVKIMAIQPQGQNSIALMGQVVDETIYTDAIGTAPELGDPTVCLTLMRLTLAETAAENGYRASWAGAATQYRVEVNVDGGGYEILGDLVTYFSIIFTEAVNETITVRVTPYLEGTLHSEAAMTASIEYPPAVLDLDVTVDGDSADATWTAVEDADSYTVQLWADDVLRGEREVTTTSTSITADQMVAMGGPPWLEFEIRVAANVNGKQGQFAAEEVTVPDLAAPAGLALEQTLAGAVILSWSPVANATGYRLYMSETQGFNPTSGGALRDDGSDTGAVVSLDLTEPYAYYFRVAASDAWHRDRAGLVFGDELEVAAGVVWLTDMWATRGVTQVTYDGAGGQLYVTNTNAQHTNLDDSSESEINLLPSYVVNYLCPAFWFVTGRATPVLVAGATVIKLMVRTAGFGYGCDSEADLTIKLDLVSVSSAGAVTELTNKNDISSYITGERGRLFAGGFDNEDGTWGGLTSFPQDYISHMRPVVDFANGRIWFEVNFYNEAACNGLFSFSFDTVADHDDQVDVASIGGFTRHFAGELSGLALSNDPLAVGDGGVNGVLFAGRMSNSGSLSGLGALLRVNSGHTGYSVVCDFTGEASAAVVCDLCFGADGGLWMLILLGNSDGSVFTDRLYHFGVETVRTATFSPSAADATINLPSVGSSIHRRGSIFANYQDGKLYAAVANESYLPQPYTLLRLYSIAPDGEGGYETPALELEENAGLDASTTRWLSWGVGGYNYQE